MSALSYRKLFMSEVASSDDQGVMDLGKNCLLCNQLDFLPFHCEFCNKTYCSTHRSLEVHNCVGRPQRTSHGQQYSGPTAASLFPDRAKDVKQLNALMKSTELGSLKDKSSAGKASPFMKLTKFLHIQRMNRMSEQKKLSLFKSKSQKPNPVIELAKVKKLAKGPAAISVHDRLYVWVLFVDRNVEDLHEISLEKDRRAVWVLKNWSVGRALDSIAETLAVGNYNNSSQTSTVRLALFKLEGDTPVALETAKKTAQTFSAADTLFLVRGEI